MGMSLQSAFELSKIDPWFLSQVEDIVLTEKSIEGKDIEGIQAETFLELKKKGFSDKRLSEILICSEEVFRNKRLALDIKPVFKRVDSCAAEFDTQTAYLYSTYQSECEANPTDNKKIMILGGGPNRIGQGIEFDYCCVHASLALQKVGYETIMINCNPETVSTCLLYTSPSPRDATLSRMPSSA